MNESTGEYEKSGYDFTKYLIENEVYPKKIYLHTSNPVGRDNLYQILKRYMPEDAKIYPYPIQVKELT